MTNPGLPPRRGAHRAPRQTLAVVVPSVVAVVLVLALVGALYLLLGTRDGRDVAGPATVSPRPSAPTSPGSPTPGVSTPPAPTTTPTASVTSPPTTRPATPSPGATTDQAVPRPSVVVLNQSREAGLAGRVADMLREAGWTVAATGNFRGTVVATTVYYPSGLADAAAALAADLPGPDRIRPVFGNLSTTRLTVVLTSSYPG